VAGGFLHVFGLGAFLERRRDEGRAHRMCGVPPVVPDQKIITFAPAVLELMCLINSVIGQNGRVRLSCKLNACCILEWRTILAGCGIKKVSAAKADDSSKETAAVVRTKRIEWRRLEDGTQEGANEQYDFVISREGEGAILDAFDVAKPDNDDAHLQSMHCESVDEAKEAAETFAGSIARKVAAARKARAARSVRTEL
jgi:hypothetical protein